MNEMTKKISLLGTGLVVGAAAFTVVGASAHPADGDGEGYRHQRGEVVSEVLGVSANQLREAKRSGQTLDQIVTENGFESVEAFETAMEEAMRTKLAEMGLSQEEIDAKVVAMRERHQVRDDIGAAREELLSLSREQVVEKKNAGMTFEEILAEAGYDSKEAFHEALTGSLSQSWSEQGVDQAEIDERLEKLETRFEKGKMGRKGFGDHRNGFGGEAEES